METTCLGLRPKLLELQGALGMESHNVPILHIGNQSQERSDDVPKVRQAAKLSHKLGGFPFFQAPPLPSRY